MQATFERAAASMTTAYAAPITRAIYNGAPTAEAAFP